MDKMKMYSVDKPETFYNQIYDSLKEMIFQGVLQPGERIYETQLARSFNVSRSPVREAVKALEKEGLLVTDEKSRINVFKPTLKDFEEIYQCRQALEGLSTRLATQLAADEELEVIDEILLQTRYSLDHNPEDKNMTISYNSKFHDSITQYSRNRILQKQLQDLKSLSHYFRVINFNGENRGWVLYHEHEEIFHFMKQRKEEEAAKAMERHIQHDLKHFQEISQLYPFFAVSK